GRRQGVGDERRQLGRVIDDVDLLLTQLAHHGTHAAAHFTDAGALGVDARLVRANGYLGAVSGLACERDDLHDASGELWNLKFEEATYEPRVGAGDGDLRALQTLGDARDVDADPCAVCVHLAWNLLLRG